MIDLKLVLVFSCAVALLGMSQVEAASRVEREVEAAGIPETTGAAESGSGLSMDKIQQQLTATFDSMKRTADELASKLNSEDIVQGLQGLASKLETLTKQAAEQFNSAVSGMTETKAEEPKPEEPKPEGS